MRNGGSLAVRCLGGQLGHVLPTGPKTPPAPLLASKLRQRQGSNRGLAGTVRPAPGRLAQLGGVERPGLPPREGSAGSDPVPPPMLRCPAVFIRAGPGRQDTAPHYGGGAFSLFLPYRSEETPATRRHPPPQGEAGRRGAIVPTRDAAHSRAGALAAGTSLPRFSSGTEGG